MELGDDVVHELDHAPVVLLRKVVPLEAAAPPPEQLQTEYSVVLRAPRPTQPPAREALPPPPPPPVTWSVARPPKPPSPKPARPAAPKPTRHPTPLAVEQSSPSSRKRDVIDEMLADLMTPSPDDEPAFAMPLPEPTPAVTTAIDPKRRRKVMSLVAMAVAGATLFVAGAGVALHVSRANAPAAVER
jgi:hypothetical protein